MNNKHGLFLSLLPLLALSACTASTASTNSNANYYEKAAAIDLTYTRAYSLGTSQGHFPAAQFHYSFQQEGAGTCDADFVVGEYFHQKLINYPTSIQEVYYLRKEGTPYCLKKSELGEATSELLSEDNFHVSMGNAAIALFELGPYPHTDAYLGPLPAVRLLESQLGEYHPVVAQNSLSAASPVVVSSTFTGLTSSGAGSLSFALSYDTHNPSRSQHIDGSYVFENGLVKHWEEKTIYNNLLTSGKTPITYRYHNTVDVDYTSATVTSPNFSEYPASTSA